MGQREQLLDELDRCAADKDYFKSTYIRIPDRRTGATVPLIANPMQAKLREVRAKSRKVDILKARRGGVTTEVCADLLHEALFHNNFGVCAAAHTEEATKVIFHIYQMMYDGLPEVFKALWKLQPAYGRKLVFPNGSFIRALTAGSDSGHGDTFRAVHGSEYARWENPEEASKSTFGAIADKNTGIVVIESTADGMNHFHAKYGRDDGATKLFFPWTMDPGLRSPSRIKDPDENMRAYAFDHGLDEEQMNWAINALYDEVCLGSWSTFNEQYPATAELAFITSGARFFNTHFEGGMEYEGLEVYDQTAFEQRRFRVYSLGVDAAGGNPNGDFSAAGLIDITDPEKPVEAAAFMRRIPPSRLAEQLGDLLIKPFNPIVVVERGNGWGEAVIERLEDQGHGNFYVETVVAVVGSELTTRMGFTTSTRGRRRLLDTLGEMVNSKGFLPRDPRWRFQANTFVHTLSGKIEHDTRCHDDLIFAYALALMGIEQADFMLLSNEAEEPKTNDEIPAWEIAHRRTWVPGAGQKEGPQWGGIIALPGDFW